MVSAVGYGGTIDLMVGLNPEGSITGVQVLRHTETPGLGAKITEEKFLKQFIAKNVRDTNWSLKKEGGDIDQVSGATISPQAVVKALNGGLTLFSDNKDKILGAG
jgi:electron transport complex protein RnfG